MNLNQIIGIFLIVLGTLVIVLAFLIAVRQYIFPPKTSQKALAPSDDAIKLFLQLLDDMLKAPPALAFLVTGILIGSIGIWILIAKPI